MKAHISNRTVRWHDGRLLFETIQALDIPLVVLGSDGTPVVSTSRFQELLASPKVSQCLERCIGDSIAKGGHQESTCARFDGRTIAINVVPIAGGFLATIDEAEGRRCDVRLPEGARADTLTHLDGRSAFRIRLEAALRSKAEQEFSVLTIGLDRFKSINEALGQNVGDAVLRTVADRIRSVLDENDFAARFGGDEFAVLRQPTSSGAELAKRLVDLLARSYLVEGNLINLTASIGVAVAGEESCADDIQRSADLALKRAKQDGGNGFQIFEGSMEAEVRARRTLEIDLRRALAMREFSLVYQPQYNLETQTVTGFEALLRWHHPTRGLVSPAQFIPLAEEIGLIVPIGDWVLRTACREAAGWPFSLNIAVNVSAVQFGNSGLMHEVVSALATSGLDPRRLELEITESVLLGDHARAVKVLNQIHAMGVRVSMDDFGTGYSSLSYLHSFPFDKIKIDQSFVRGDQSGMAIVRAIAALGRSLGMTTTAEGVETDAQLARIAAYGCTDVQGYLISKPLPADQVTEFLRSKQTGEPPSSTIQYKKGKCSDD